MRALKMLPTLLFAAVLLTAIAGCKQNGGGDTIVIAFQPQEDVSKLTPNAERLATFVEEHSGMRTRAYLPTDYVTVVESLRGKQADVAYFSAWPYVLSQSLAETEIFAAEKRSEGPFYWSQWYVPADSKAENLQDLVGKRIAFTSPTSTSGYLFPLSALVEEGVLKTGQDPAEKFSAVTFAGGYEQALKALASGQVDAAAASDYAPERYLSEEQRKSIRVLRKQGPVPSHVLAFRKGLDSGTKEKIQRAFLALNEEENRAVLEAAYGAEELLSADDSHVEAVTKALTATGLGQEIASFDH